MHRAKLLLYYIQLCDNLIFNLPIDLHPIEITVKLPYQFIRYTVEITFFIQLTTFSLSFLLFFFFFFLFYSPQCFL
jgi:hypothetical protein